MDKPKAKKDPFMYLPWAGQSVDPVLEPELFAKLPGWRQRERLFIRKMVEQRLDFTIEDVRKAGIGDVQEGAAVVTLPTALTYHSLSSRAGGDPPVGNMMQELQDALTDDLISLHCTALGEGRRLVPQMPSHGLYAYIWGLALVQKKLLPTLPLPFFWELEEGIHAITGKKLNVRTKAADLLFSWLDRRADSLVSNLS